MACQRSVVYSFDLNGWKFKVPPRNVFEVDGRPWMHLLAHEGPLAKFMAAETGKTANYTLANHKGWLELIQLRNDAHLATYQDQQASQKAASKSAMSRLFGAASGKRGADDEADGSATKVAKKSNVWPAAARRRSSNAMTVTVCLDGVHVELQRPECAGEPIAIPCEAVPFEAVTLAYQYVSITAAYQ